MEAPKWEDLIMDCLVNVFGRVGIESLVLDVPFVCKSWYEATLDSRCWQSLVFPDDLLKSRITGGYEDKELFDVGKFIRFVVNRSQKSATVLALPKNCARTELIFVGKQCPSLKYLSLAYDQVAFDRDCIILINIERWKDLESLTLENVFYLKIFVSQVGIHCKNFVALSVLRAKIYYDTTLAITEMLPMLKYLVLSESFLERKNLLMILESCQALVHLDVSYCEGFESDDEEILQLASHIKTFKCQGSRRIRDDELFRDDDDWELDPEGPSTLAGLPPERDHIYIVSALEKARGLEPYGLRN
ncbi:hypothetical protein LguiA_001800 [Lonicera macranthoides]